MRREWEAIKIAFALYSRVPVKGCGWAEDARARALFWFPLVGLGLSALEILAFLALRTLGFDALLCGAAAVLLNIGYTGGIHMDGFCDVVDAQSAHASRERMLEIMKDPHCGAFAAIGAGAYLVAALALWTHLAQSPAAFACACLGFMLSRCLSALCALRLPPARQDGMLRALTKPAGAGRGTGFLVAGALALCGGMLAVSPAAGCGVALGAGLALWYYRRMALKKFGGVTGDLAGWFLQVCEIAMAAGAVLAPRIWEALQCI